MADNSSGGDQVNTQPGQLAKALLGSVVRHGVTVVATYFISKGILLPGQEGSFVDLLSGVVVAAAMLGWSMLQKFTKHAEVVGIKQAFVDYVKAVQQGQKPTTPLVVRKAINP